MLKSEFGNKKIFCEIQISLSCFAEILINPWFLGIIMSTNRINCLIKKYSEQTKNLSKF